MKKALAIALLIGLVLPIAVSAVNLGENLSANQTQAQQKITNYMGNITTLIRTIGLAVGVVALSAGGIMFMASSEDPSKRDQAKQIIKMGLAGAIIIALAPSIMQFMLG